MCLDIFSRTKQRDLGTGRLKNLRRRRLNREVGNLHAKRHDLCEVRKRFAKLANARLVIVQLFDLQFLFANFGLMRQDLGVTLGFGPDIVFD